MKRLRIVNTGHLTRALGRDNYIFRNMYKVAFAIFLEETYWNLITTLEEMHIEELSSNNRDLESQ